MAKNYTVVIWNFQNFGVDSWFKERSAAESFIQIIIDEYSIDAMIIEECKQSGIHSLTTFNAGGQFVADVVGGTLDVNNGESPESYSTNNAKIPGSANSEGYMVIARQYRLSPLKSRMSERARVGGGKKGVKKNSYIRLCTRGYQFQRESNYKFPLRVSSSIRTAARFPITEATSKKSKHDLSVINARRPCVVDFKTASGSLIKIIAYHAPVEEENPVLGAACVGALEEVVNNTDFPNIIVGGDFNMTKKSQFEKGFSLLLRTELDIVQGTKGSSTCPNPNLLKPLVTPPDNSSKYQRSMVNYLTGKILNKSTTPNYQSPRDQIFYRFDSTIMGLNGNQINSGVLDLVLELCKNGTLAYKVRDNAIIKSYVQKGILNFAFPSIIKADGTLKDKLSDIFTPHNLNPFPNQLVASAFLRVFMSDHLPLFVAFKA